VGDRLVRIGRLAAAARGLEREGAYNGAKLVRTVLTSELTRYAESEAPSGGDAAAGAVEALLADMEGDLPAAIVPHLRKIPGPVRSGDTIPLADAPRCHVCRVCGEILVGEDIPVSCPTCAAPALSFREELPVWYLEPADPGAILAALAVGTRHVLDAMRGAGDAALARPPAAGEWSARQTLEHLLFAEELFARRVERLLAEQEPDLASAAVWSQTPVSSDEGLAETGEAASAIAARIRELRGATVARLAALPDADWGRGGRHPEWGRVTVLSQAAYFARHEASHMAQLAAAAEGRLPRRVAPGSGA
jgi:uncharacterized damage-inducible protein DinB